MMEVGERWSHRSCRRLLRNWQPQREEEVEMMGYSHVEAGGLAEDRWAIARPFEVEQQGLEALGCHERS